MSESSKKPAVVLPKVAPHKQLQKQQAMKNARSNMPQQKVMRNTGRGR